MTDRALPGGKLILVAEGRPTCRIELPAEPTDLERLAAEELVEHLESMSGARVPIVTQGEEAKPGVVRVLVGAAALADVPDLRPERAMGARDDELSCRDGFVLRASDGVIAMSGLPQKLPALRPKGTLYAAYDLLERLGCRWPWPGELGRVVPKRRTVALEPFESVQTPSFDMRFTLYWRGGDYHESGPEYMTWYRRNRVNEDYPWRIGHNPDFIGLVKDPNDLKFAPEAVDELILPWFEKDPQKLWYGAGWKDDYQHVSVDQGLSAKHPWVPIYQSSDTMFRFLNAVAEDLRKKMPDRPRVLGVFAYMNYIVPPISVAPHPDLSVTVPVIEQCPQHVPFTGVCWQRDATMRIAQTWGELSPKTIWFDYEPGFLVSGGVPMPHTRRLRKEVPLLHEYGLRGVYTMVQPTVANNGPNVYLRARLYWDVNRDADEVLDEYFALLFGDGAKHVRAYWDALEDLMHAPGVHQHEDEAVKSIFPLQKVRPLGKHIARAEKAVGNEEPYRTRVKVMRFSYENFIAYLRMREAEDRADFAEAAAIGKAMLAERKKIREMYSHAYNLGAINRSDEESSFTAGGWIRQNVERARKVDGTEGELVATLPDKWYFKTDPRELGLVQRWFEPESEPESWQSIRTSRHWEVQGLQDEVGHGYDGVAWYRVEAEVPAKFDGAPVKLNFGGVFGRALVWVNGKYAGYRPYETPWWMNAYNESFDIDVSDAVRAGERNTIVVRVQNESEWGGIFRRVFLWSPKAQESVQAVEPAR